MKNSLTERLKSLLQEDKADEAARQIARAGEEIFGEENFVFRGEAAKIAVLDLGALDKFYNEVLSIRMHLDESYAHATKKLTEGDDNENT